MTMKRQGLKNSKQEVLKRWIKYTNKSGSWGMSKRGISWFSIPGIYGKWRGPTEVWPLFAYLKEDFR